ncbi:hypothetical protein FHS96_000881 [Sphingomonas zeicaulis]|uniref:hypothetical protein n=1 Tax=Sphingomonas zeicaulis TaxID=1632740 RepID=UPI003D1A6596
MNELFSGGLYGVVTIVGPILLLAALAFAILRNRKRTPADRQRTEQATRELREQLSDEDRARDRNP